MGSFSKWVKIIGNLDAVTLAYVNGMATKPSSAFIQVINELVRDKETVNGTTYKFKDIFINSRGDVIYLGNKNNSNDSFRNLVKNAHHGTIQGSGLVFDSYWNWSNPDGTGYVDTNYNPSTQAVRYTLNNAGIGIYPTDNGGNMKYAIYCYEDTTKRAGFLLGYHAVNDGANGVLTLPFYAGLNFARRTASNARTFLNQNVPNASTSQVSTSIPNSNFYLFRHTSSGGANNYLGGLNFTYIGASLTDNEVTALNIMVNRYYKKCLYLKYGADNWGVKMAKSYFDTLHNFEPYEAWEIYEFIKRMQPDHVDGAGTGYYYNTFGPSGQNKTVADFIMLFKAGGNLAANAWTKTGATLRWNQDGSIANSNTMPSYTRGTNLGIVTVSSTDGWDGVSVLQIAHSNNSVNSYYGNFPLIEKLRTASSFATIALGTNRIKVNALDSKYTGASNIMSNISTPGYMKYNLDNLVGKTITGYAYFYGYGVNSLITGNMSLWTNEYRSSRAFYMGGSSANRLENITGTLANFVLDNATVDIIMIYLGITGGFGTWNKNISSCNFSECRFNTAAVDSQLSVINTYFASNTPIKILTLTLSGTTMGIPTGGANNADLLDIVAKHSAAGFTAVINVRTS